MNMKIVGYPNLNTHWIRNTFGRKKKILAANPNLSHQYPLRIGFIHFSTILATDKKGNPNNTREGNNVNRANMDEIPLSDIEYALFNSPITDEEIIECVHKLNVNKASSGNLSSKHFKYSIELLLTYIRKFFNRLFTNSEFPSAWTETVRIPI